VGAERRDRRGERGAGTGEGEAARTREDDMGGYQRRVKYVSRYNL
jgi:hypothetical protein